MKPNELTDEHFFLTGNNGHILADKEAHIAKKGLEPKTLCGILMLFTNYYPAHKDEVNKVCPQCVKEFNNVAELKPVPKKNRTYQSIFAEAYKAMHKNNPEHHHPHRVEDWAIENFMDRCTALGYKGYADRAREWWNKQNDTGLRPVKVELTPDELAFLISTLEDIKEEPQEIDMQALQIKLEQAADESIVGD